MPNTEKYQHNFSRQFTHVFDKENRERKAVTMLRVLLDYCARERLKGADILSIGASTGVIESYLADSCRSITGIDIDSAAISFARENFRKKNLSFQVRDALTSNYRDECFDVILCNHVYEHVPSVEKLMEEIHRMLRPNGFCYFTAGNRLALREPHYNLFFLSILPKFLANYYLRLTGKGKYYYEKHLTCWGLKKIVRQFHVVDYSGKLIESPDKFAAEYMLPPHSIKHAVARFMMQYLYVLCPTYVWILEKRD